MQQGSANVFCVYRHADLNKSELVAERVSYDEMWYAIHREEYLAKMTNHNALSVMASFAEYDALLTRCYIWEVDAGMYNTECNKSARSNVHNCEYSQDKLNNCSISAEVMQNCISNWDSLVEAVAMEITQHLPRSSLIECGRASHQLHCVGAFVLCRQEDNFWSKENLTQNDYSANTMCIYNKYHMGVITHGVAHDMKIVELIDRLSMKVFHAYPHYNDVVVPIAAHLRHVQLKVWWTPCLERVTPLSTLPLLRVTLEEVCSPQLYIKKEQQQQEYNQKCSDITNNHYNVLCERTNAQCNSVSSKDKRECHGQTTLKRESVAINMNDTLYFIAYTRVELFLCRPINSELIGTCVQYVKHVNTHNTQMTKPLDDHEEIVMIDDSTRKQDNTSYAKHSLKTTQTTITEQVQKPLVYNDIALHNNYHDEHTESVINNHQHDDKVQMKKIWSRSSRSGVMQALLIFDDLAVTNTGEHLIGVQVEVDKPFRPFVPVLCAYINPFLVVERDSAESERS